MLIFISSSLLLATHLLIVEKLRTANVKSSVQLQWQEASASLVPGRYRHSLVENQGTLYVIGGKAANQNEVPPTETILCGRTSNNGDVIQWGVARTRIKEAVNDPAVLMIQGYIYVMGGRDASDSPSKLVHIAPANLCDQTVQWKSGISLPVRLERSAATYYDGAIYVVGGVDEQRKIRGETYSAIVTAPGGLSRWNDNLPALDDPPLDHPLFIHSLFAANDYLYAVGGYSKSGRQRSIYRAKITSPGVISNWAALSMTNWLASPLSTLHTVVAGNRVYVVGGYNGVSTDEVFSAELYSDGSMGAWTPEERLPKRFHWHGVTLAANGSIYVAGGLTDNTLQSSIYYIPPLTLTKSSDPSGPVHEGDVITYTISYANTSLITQVITITDLLPFNVTLVPGSISWPGKRQGSTLVWELGEVPPGESGSASFKVHVPLLPSVHPESAAALGSPAPSPPPARVLPAPITCDTTRFWAIGVTRQPPEPKPHTIQVQIPPGAAPSQMWLAVKEASDIGLTVDGIQATRIATSNNQIGASLWSAPITTEAVDSGMVTVVTGSPRRLNALFLFDEDDPPFDETNLYDVYNNAATVPETFTYTLEIPSVETQTVDVLLPFMDISYWRDDLQPDTRVTTVTVEFNAQSHTVAASDPNLGNGLLMTDFPFDIGSYTDAITKTMVLTISVDTEDSIYTLGPRVCRPVYVENTAWLCSDQAGCISDTAVNIPPNFAPPSVYLPIIMKSSP
jgi:uncharacterized repeat protein (TIGR01451 family)